MKRTKLTEEVNKLILNTLAKDGGVYLPEIGSLTLKDKRRGASIQYTREAVHQSLVLTISQRGNCSEAQANQLYKKWLGEVKREGGEVVIDGIGTIKGGAFTMSTELTERLDDAPQEAEETPVVEEAPVVEKEVEKEAEEPKKSSTPKCAIYLIAAVILAVAGFALCNSNDKSAEPIPAPQPAVVEEVVAEKIVPIEEPAPEPIVIEEPKRVIDKIKSKARYATYPEAAAALERTLAVSNSPKKFRVVCGMLKYRGTTGRLILDVENRATSDVECRVYSRNGLYMVTLFESDNIHACYNFMKSDDGQLYDNVWVYNESAF